jgi:trans-aconitate methyltransferase
LDFGGIDHCFVGQKKSQGTWLHAMVASRASSCLGVDILADSVREINASGEYRFMESNVEALTFKEEFDVVVAGEIIEHVYNAGRMLDSAWNALRPDGLLVITTPNNTALSAMLYSLIIGKEKCHTEHTCYYSAQTLTYLVEHHGFDVVECCLCPRPSRSRIIHWLRSAACYLRPCLGETLVLIARKKFEQQKYGDKW